MKDASEGVFIPINKGNYLIEPLEREKCWHAILGSGWEQEYNAYRETWREAPKDKLVGRYPLLVDLELSTVCNLRCPMCYTITPEFKKRVCAEFMAEDLFKKIVDEIAGKVPAIRLSLRGEPTLHPRFVDCLRYAKQAGIREVSTLTNGSKLTREFFLQIMHAGIDWITISIDGMGATYEKIRSPLKYSVILQTIKMMKEEKERFKMQKPVVKIQTVWPAIRGDPESYYNTFLPYTDLIAINPLIDYLNKDEDIVYEENFACPQQYQRMVVCADGKVLACANDEDGSNVVGDAYKQSIANIWHGSKLNEMRESQSYKGGYKKYDICKKCYLPRKTIQDEIIYIGGRKIIIKDYINRVQTIGA